VRLSELPGSLYLCAADQDGVLTLFGLPMRTAVSYHTVHLGPPQDALVLEATIAALHDALHGAVAGQRPWTATAATPWWTPGHRSRSGGRRPAPDLAPPSVCPASPVETELHHLTVHHALAARAQPAIAGGLLPDCSNGTVRCWRIWRRVARPGEADRASVRVSSPAVVRHVNLPYIGSTEAFTNITSRSSTKRSF